MVITRNVILYFIQIRHTDDFLSTGTRLVILINNNNKHARCYHTACVSLPTFDFSIDELKAHLHIKWSDDVSAATIFN